MRCQTSNLFTNFKYSLILVIRMDIIEQEVVI